MKGKCLTDYFRDLKKGEFYECEDGGEVECFKKKYPMVIVGKNRYLKENFSFEEVQPTQEISDDF